MICIMHLLIKLWEVIDLAVIAIFLRICKNINRVDYDKMICVAISFFL